MKIEKTGALVTGAASGMGRATAKALARAGANVTLLDVNADGVKQAAAENGGTAFPCDMRDPRQIEQVVGAAIEKVGPVRILASCAGIGRIEPMVGPAAVPFSQLVETIGVNLIGTLAVVRAVATDLLQREALEDGERGVMVMVASGAAFDGPDASSAYAASKGGIVSATLSLAREFGDYGIRVNTISPGAFDTAMIKDLPAQMLAMVPAITPFPKRMGAPDEFAALAMHIFTNRFLNGSVIRLDGANRMPYYSTAALPGG
jgi:NAD(P)-dependent dehydrogenase (short-subunit alcohol dehydrogenase family)